MTGIISLPASSLDALMPMHVLLTADARISQAGPTVKKLLGPWPSMGADFFEHFIVRRPHGVSEACRLYQAAGERLQIGLRRKPDLALKGVAAKDGSGGLVLDLSFGITVSEAVAHYGLTAGDFSPTSLAVEMLYLVEANSAAIAESHKLNLRLDAARSSAELQARTDALTGLHNRRGMEDYVANLLRRRQDFGLLHVDLDYFKSINDSFGHDAGDHVLREVAAALVAETRGCDLVVRFGGDEFVLILRDIVRAGELGDFARRIIRRLDAPITYRDAECRVSASIGVTVSTFYAVPDLATMLRDADVALYQSKVSGRSCVRFHLTEDGVRSGGHGG